MTDVSICLPEEPKIKAYFNLVVFLLKAVPFTLHNSANETFAVALLLLLIITAHSNGVILQHDTVQVLLLIMQWVKMK